MEADLFLKADIYSLAIYIRGNKLGKPVIFLHGGPGGHITEECFSFFNLEKFRVYAFDQRGCGNTLPFASLINNTIDDSINDINIIIDYYKLKNVIVFGGSYGSTLALAYSIKYPDNISSLVLRGIFLGRNEDNYWLYQEGASYYYPDEYEAYSSFIDKDKRNNLLKAYYEIFISDDEKRKLLACKSFSNWEASLVHLYQKKISSEITNYDISIALLECHYFVNGIFKDDNYILNNASKLKDINCYIVHGRYDIDCRPIAAYLLHKALPNSKLFLTNASGHSPYEKNSYKKLCSIMASLE